MTAADALRSYLGARAVVSEESPDSAIADLDGVSYWLGRHPEAGTWCAVRRVQVVDGIGEGETPDGALGAILPTGAP